MNAVQPELFKYVDEFADKIRDGSYGYDDDLDPELHDIFTFCELFFDQFFGEAGTNITGFTQRSRERAAELIEGLHGSDEGTPEVRKMIVLYEEFCDMNDDAHGGYGGGTRIDLLTFHQDYLSALLDAAHEWAESEGRQELEQCIASTIANYRTAIEGAQWLIP
jgi:hypothetical protein